MTDSISTSPEKAKRLRRVRAMTQYNSLRDKPDFAEKYGAVITLRDILFSVPDRFQCSGQENIITIISAVFGKDECVKYALELASNESCIDSRSKSDEQHQLWIMCLYKAAWTSGIELLDLLKGLAGPVRDRLANDLVNAHQLSGGKMTPKDLGMADTSGLQDLLMETLQAYHKNFK